MKVAVIAACIVLPMIPGPASAASTTTVRATPNGNGATPATSVPDTTSPDLSLDGTRLAFSSDASNIVSGDTNGVADVFVRITPLTSAARTVRASVSASGAQANGASYSPSLSVDGHWLAFVSEATNLVSGDTNGFADVFLKDMIRGTITRISVTSWGAQADGRSFDPFVSLFGTFVTFESEATNLSAQDENGLQDAFVRDIKRRRTERLVAPPVNDDLDVPVEVNTLGAQISYDGRYVSYSVQARREARFDPIARDVWVRDRVKNRTKHLIVPAWASRTREMVEEPVISADGRYIAMTAWSALSETDSVANQSDIGRQTKQYAANNDALTRNPFDYKDVWVYDQVTATVIPISSTGIGGAPELDGDSYGPQISANGHSIAFISEATNLVAGDTNGAPDVFVRDLEERTAVRMSMTHANSEVSVASARPSMTYEGRYVAFVTAASMQSDDKNQANDIYIRDRANRTAGRAPVLRKPFSGYRAVNQLETVTIQLRARDADGDPIRYDTIGVVPTGFDVNPTTGVATWHVAPSQQTGRVYVNFWAQDPRGFSSLTFVAIYVRDTRQTATCLAASICDE